jgi:hypothetical protein
MAGLFLFPQTLEISISPITDAVPEPSTWAMLLIGFAGIGLRCLPPQTWSEPGERWIRARKQPDPVLGTWSLQTRTGRSSLSDDTSRVIVTAGYDEVDRYQCAKDDQERDEAPYGTEENYGEDQQKCPGSDISSDLAASIDAVLFSGKVRHVEFLRPVSLG